MLLVRALNDYDIVVDPLKNGLASKQMIYDLVKRHYENASDSEYGKLNDDEKDLFIKDHFEEYLISHRHKLERVFIRNSNQYRNNVAEYRKFLNIIKSNTIDENIEIVKNNVDNINFGSYIHIMKYFSELQRHLLYGTTKITDWISFSKSLESIMKYYENQKTHQVAIIKPTDALFTQDNILYVDLSCYESIEKKLNCLCNGIDSKCIPAIDVLAEISRKVPITMFNFKSSLINQTNINSRGFKYSVNSKEVCMYRYLPKEYVISLLDALQMDLIRHKKFNMEFIYLSQREQEKELNRFKFLLFEQLKEFDNSYLLYLFDELYMKNRNINDLVSFDQSKPYIEANRNKILSLSSKIPSAMVKMKF